MIYKVVLQPRAESDIAESYKYIAQQAPQAAARWYLKLKAEIRSLSKMPARCPLSPESKKLGIELRQLQFGKRSGRYRIIFCIYKHSREVHVLSVRHGARKPLEIADLDYK